MSRVIVNIDVELVQRIDDLYNTMVRFKERYKKPNIISRWKWRKIQKIYNVLVDDVQNAYSSGEKRFYMNRAIRTFYTYSVMDDDYK